MPRFLVSVHSEQWLNYFVEAMDEEEAITLTYKANIDDFISTHSEFTIRDIEEVQE